jgi:hypothetical protein
VSFLYVERTGLVGGGERSLYPVNRREAGPTSDRRAGATAGCRSDEPSALEVGLQVPLQPLDRALA